jgi:hypothetical protein
MSAFEIQTVDDVYQFVERLKTECQKNEATQLLAQLDDALHLGSSSLEVLGAVRQTIISNRASIERLLGAAGKNDANQVVAFVDQAFGR